MPEGYKHLTRDQRCQISVLKSSGFFQYQIAEKMGVSPSTISRELKRNSETSDYDFHLADGKARVRRWLASKKPKKMFPNIIKKIEGHIHEEWSPEQISGRLRLEGIDISHESIYQHIWKNKQKGGILYKHLRHSGKKYKKRSSGKAGRGLIPNRVDIKERPAIVERKSRIGDWEGDTIVSRKSKAAILSYVDRKSKFTILAKLQSKTANNVVIKTVERLSKLRGVSHTITYDNGMEFASHELISKKIGVRCYFATPYHSWERGLNEHTNGLVRQYFPKSSDLALASNEEIMRVENLLNNRPRKVLGYKKPKEVLMAAMSPASRIALHG